MKKTNNKETRQQVKQYIIDCLNANYGYKTLENNLQEAVNNWERYTKYHTRDGKIRYQNITLVEFLTNYDCTFDIFFDDQRQLVETWLDETKEESAKYNNEKMTILFKRLIAQELSKLISKEGKKETLETYQKVIWLML